MSSAAVHGAVHVAGSVNVTWYCMVSLPVRVNRSVSRSAGDDPRVFALRLLVSTTSVAPSDRPCASPRYIGIFGDSGVRGADGLIGPIGPIGPIGMMRVSWISSYVIA